MKPSEAGKNLGVQLNKYFGEIATRNYNVKSKIETGLAIVDALVASPDDCVGYTQSAKTFQFTMKMSQKMELQDMVMFDGLVLDTLKQIHEGSTNVHSANCASAIPTDFLSKS
ncbi:MAG: hypothetical protein NUV58_01600 [Candidatus Roizmanbacteria bacterium]|nr:hypothetical protein [Candidatus Roizmanbacteria bacterium]